MEQIYGFIYHTHATLVVFSAYTVAINILSHFTSSKLHIIVINVFRIGGESCSLFETNEILILNLTRILQL